MTTEELLRLIEEETAWHRRPGHDPREHDVFGSTCAVTIGSLFTRAGVPRRTIERAIEAARLEGVPIITDGGIRVAQTAAEATALGDWLDARMDSQRRTRDAVYAAALLLPGPVRSEAPEATVAAVAPAEQPTLGLVAA